MITICEILILLSLTMALMRIWRGPSIYDRLIGYDALIIGLLAGMGVLSFVWDSVEFIDYALITSILGFASSTAFLDALWNQGAKEPRL